MATITVRLLGNPRSDDIDADGAFPSKGYQLLALIASRAGGRISRREAAALLWEDRADRQASANLRQLLARLRRLADDRNAALVRVDRETIALGPGSSAIDLVAFEGAASRGDFALALQLYAGDLLEGCFNIGADYAEWLNFRRSELRERFFGIVAAALVGATRFGSARADDLLRIEARALAIDPTREAAYRALIEAYGRCGHIDDVDRLLRNLSAMLLREFGAAPSRETVNAARKVFATVRDPSIGADHAHAIRANRPRLAVLAPTWLRPDARSPVVRALVEDVANELSRYRSFVVLAPESTFRVAHELGASVESHSLRAQFVVSGFVKPGERNDRLALRMVRTASSEIVWAAEFPLTFEDLAALFRLLSVRIATSIAAEIERSLLDESRRSAAPGAYAHYLDGQAGLKSCDLRMIRRARSSFKAAADADGRFSAAHARIAQTLYLEWLSLGGDDPAILRAARDRAEIAARQDPGTSLGALMSGVVALYQRDFDRSSEMFAQAEALNPNSAELLVEHADALAYFGQAEAGWRKFQQATELNPLALDHHWWAGASIAFNNRLFGEAVDLCGRVESQDTVFRLLAASHAQLGNLDEARRYGAALKEQFPGKSADDLVKLAPFRNAADLEPLTDGLRMAGVP